MNENNIIDENKINEIRSSVDIVEVISSYIPLTGKGKNFFGVCPFHDDHAPSMSVSKDRQIYKCFSCGAGGNVFTFVKDYENISFIEAVKKLADKAGILLNIKSFENTSTTKYKKYYEMYDIASKLYINNINTQEGKEAREYLKTRKIDIETIKEFKIGLSIKNNKLLTNLLLKKGYTEKELIDLGLSNINDRGIHDIYYNRIMFPLFDLKGNIIGFSGRIYNQDDSSKYVNTKETVIFKKGELLYNYHKTKNLARQKDEIIVVEGFMDVIRLHTIGIDNVIATMGTSVTKEQVNIIKKMAKNIILMFDGDRAGAKANYNVSTMLNEQGIEAKIVALEENLDPDEYIIKYGREKILHKIEYPLNTMDFKLEYLKKEKDLSSGTDKAKYINEVIEELNKINDPILREVTIDKISEETGIDKNFLKEQLEEIKEIIPIEKIVLKKPVSNKITGYIKAEQYLLYYMLNNIEVIKIYNKQVKYMPTEKYRLLAKEINYFYQDNGYISEADIISHIRNNMQLEETLKEITLLDLKQEYTKEEIEDYIKTIRRYIIKEQMDNIAKKQKETTDKDKKNEYALEIVRLKQELSNV